MGYDAYFILDLAIFQSFWGRWPLGFDPEGLISAYVKLKHEKDDLLFLDYRNRYECVRMYVYNVWCICGHMYLHT